MAGTFTYSIRTEKTNENLIGCRVIVPFGRKKIYTGLIHSVVEDETIQSGYALKEVLEVLDEDPIMNEVQLRFIEWMSAYYMCTLGEVFNAALPSQLKLSSESFVSLIETIDPFDLDLSSKEEQLVQFLTSGDQSISEIRKFLNVSYPQRIIKSLIDKKIVHSYERVKDKFVAKKEKRIRLAAKWSEEQALDSLQEILSAKKKQLEVLVTYLRLVDIFSFPELNRNGISKKELSSECSPSSIKTLVKNGFFEEWEEIVDRFNYEVYQTEHLPSLADFQENAMREILSQFENKQTVLLRGITGSGKTEIYMNLIHQVLEEGQNALLLLPEIALTTQIISRFRKVFGSSFGVYHSRLSDNERTDIYNGCLSGKYNFVIGVRSAIFLPFDQVDLIIIDEEHEPSYKQYDPAPRYHARDAAIYLAHIHHSKVLLGSATPSLETYQNVKEDKYGYTLLNKRYMDQPLPEIRILDLKKARHRKQVKGHFTDELLKNISDTVEDKKQAILFQNQRGYAPFIQCAKCAHIPKCPNCAVSLTYHIYQNQLICHYCGYKQFMEQSCGSCGELSLKTMGSGTEMIEEELSVMLPDIRIKRMDLDTTRSKFAYQDIIDSFADAEIDVLIGTQMVSKGLDFDHVRLVGVFDADRMIHFPDFRSHERAFQLITQVSGRSGRKHERGLVLVQSSDPSQNILKHIKEGHLDLFYAEELRERERFKYPPYYRIIKVIIRHKEPQTATAAIERYHTLIRQSIGDERILGPIDPVINRIRNLYIKELIIKIEKRVNNLAAIKEYLRSTKEALLALPEFKSVLVHFDVDPV